jgi:hypothetical protein
VRLRSGAQKASSIDGGEVAHRIWRGLQGS